MSTPPTGLELTWLLTCAALEPRLDGVLLLDLPESVLPGVADAFVDMLAIAGLGQARSVLLGSHEDDDDLWTSYGTVEEASGRNLLPVAGPLAPSPNEGPLVVVVPRLARLSLAASRAATVGLGSTDSRLERHGMSMRWHTKTYWVSACPAAETGRVTPHLMDRFPVRFPASRALPQQNRLSRVLAELASRPRAEARIPRPLANWRAVLSVEGRGAPPRVSDEAIDRAIALNSASHGLRRPLALLRLARAGAWLDGKRSVTRDDVEETAVFIGLIDPSRPQGGAPHPQPDSERGLVPDQPETASATSPDGGTAQDRQTPDGDSQAIAVAEDVLIGGPAELLGPAGSPSTAGRPYPEDVAEAEREATPLRLAWQRRGGQRNDRGLIVGTTQSTGLTDLAWTDTLREAAKYQTVRRRHHPHPGTTMLVSGADLRRYRRIPEPEHLLVLVLDHTCRTSWDWTPTLAPYLQDAYRDRAAVCFVEVGGSQPQSPLRAERALLRSLLDPRAAAALDRPTGSATPLAHGLELARLTLRHAMQHGRAPVSGARLVIVTDGLGNVPLTSSLEDRAPAAVASEGVDDACAAAAALGELDAVEAIIVRAPGSPHPELVRRLAESVGPACVLVDPAPV